MSDRCAGVGDAPSHAAVTFMCRSPHRLDARSCAPFCSPIAAVATAAAAQGRAQQPRPGQRPPPLPAALPLKALVSVPAANNRCRVPFAVCVHAAPGSLCCGRKCALWKVLACEAAPPCVALCPRFKYVAGRWWCADVVANGQFCVREERPPSRNPDTSHPRAHCVALIP